MPPPNRKNLGLKNEITIAQILAKAIVTTNGFSTYQPGWTDDVVAEKAGSGIRKFHVGRIRKELYPNFKATNSAANGKLATRVGKLSDTIDSLTMLVAELERRIEIMERNQPRLVNDVTGTVDWAAPTPQPSLNQRWDQN